MSFRVRGAGRLPSPEGDVAQTISIAARRPVETGLRASHLGALGSNAWRHRELLGHLVVRSLKGQYKDSFIGYSWIVVNPLIQFFVYDFVFSSILPVPSGDVPFALVLFVALVPWIFFSNAVGSATESIVGGGSFVKAVYFPRELLVEAAVLTRLVDWIAGVAILVGLVAYFGHPISWGALWVLPMFCIYTLFTLGVCLPLAALNLFFRDVRYLVGIALMLWFFLTPIVYTMSSVPERYHWFYDLNPNARFVNSFRYILLQGGSPPLSGMALASLMAVLALALGFYIFKRMEASFADRI